MSTNILNKMDSQHMSQMVQEGVVNIASEQIKNKDEQQKSNPALQKDVLSKIINSKSADEAGKAILFEMLSKNTNPSQLTGSQKPKAVKSDFDRKLEQHDEAQDKVNISAGQTNKIIKQIVGKLFFSGKQGRDKYDESGNSGKIIEDYAEAYFEFLSTSGPKTMERLKKAENLLKEQGFSDQGIFKLQKELKNLARADISLRIKENMLKIDLSETKLEQFLNEKMASSFMSDTFFNEKLGGYDFGGYYGHLGGTAANAREWEGKELGEFALQELEKFLIDKAVADKPENMSHAERKKANDELQKLVKLCNAAGIDVNEWVNEIWQMKKYDLGLFLIDIPQNGIGTGVNTNANDQNSQQKQSREEYEPQAIDEKTLLMNRLRSLYLSRLLNRGIGNFLSFSLKIIKAENNLLKLGLQMKDVVEKLKLESESIAKQKTIEMLKEVFLERSALFKLDGTAGKLLDDKEKQLLNDAKRLGVNLSKDDAENMQYSANLEMLDIVRKKIEEISDLISKGAQYTDLESQLARYKDLEARLKGDVKEPSGEMSIEDEKSQIA